MEKIKTAIIGCGAITEKTHLPLLSKSDQFEVRALVDIAKERVSQLGKEYNVTTVSTDYNDIVDKVDAAIIALPPYANASVSTQLMKAGIHAFVEKPMAMTAGECDEMIQSAEESKVSLVVGLVRRYYPNFRLVKRMLDANVIGNLIEVDIQEGGLHKWGFKTGYSFKKDTGGGLLPTIGVHVFDSVLWWLGDYVTLEYYDDARGGVEADCLALLNYKNNTKVRIAMSRLRELRNTYIFKGEAGYIEVGHRYKSPVHIHLYDENYDYIIDHNSNVTADPDQLFLSQYRDFATSIREKKKPFIDGHEGKRSVELIGKCYSQRQPYIYPWL